MGDKVVFNPFKTCNGNAAELASMLHIEKDRTAEVTGDFEMAISEIIVLKPAEHGEEFYKEVFPGNTVTTEEEYFAELRKMIASQLLPNSDHLFNRDVQKELMTRFGNFDLPAEFLKKWLVARNEGLTAENVNEEYDKMAPSIRWELLRGKIAENLDIKVTDDDMLQFRRILEDKNYLGRMREDVGNRKLFNAIKALVNLDAKAVSLDEFKALAQAE